MGGCSSWDPFCDGSQPMTGKERREYNETVRRLGGERSAAGKAFIEEQHRRFKAAQRAHRAQQH